MKNEWIIFLTVIPLIAGLQACGGEDTAQSAEEETVLEEVKERDVIEGFLETEFAKEDGAQEDAEEAEIEKERRANTLRDISESSYKTLTCSDILDSLQVCIKQYEKEGDLGVLGYFSDLQSDSYFKACLKSNEAFKNKFNDLYMELGEIRQKKEAQEEVEKEEE